MAQKTLDGSKTTTKKGILIAIKPIWADEILSGNKKWEYRRVTMNVVPGERVLFYASGNVHAIVGEAVIEKVLNEPVNLLIEHTVNEVPESADQLRESFAGREIGHAIKIRDPVRYETPLTLAFIRQQLPRFIPPQGFYYIKEGNKLLEILLRR